MISSALKRLAPSSLLRLYMAVVLLAAAAAIGAVLTTSSVIDKESRRSTGDASAALASAQTRNLVEQQVNILAAQRARFVFTAAYLALPAEAQAAVARELGRDYLTDGGPMAADVPLLEIPLSQRDSATVQGNADRVIRSITGIVQSSDHVDGQRLAETRDLYKASLDVFYAKPTLGIQRNLIFRSQDFAGALKNASADAAAGFERDQQALGHAAGLARAAMILALIFLGATMAGATVGVGRLIQYAFAGAEQEKETLRATTDALQYRNSQLNALYNVFSEITDTLSLHHVVAATLRETLRLMNAYASAVRLLKDGELVFVGGLRADGTEVEQRPPIPLGEQIAGRAAKLGRTLRFDETRQDMLTDHQRADGLRSGLVVPLIVGARVVGVLACWWREPNAFNDQDERILEMMASQVATAVAAADSAENSERRAHHDPLTALPNRLQLDDDLEGELVALARSGRNAVVAMIDIDHFKRLNDDFGHHVGDVTLQKVASILRGAVRDNDNVYRYGGEEFVIIFKDACIEEGIALAERVRAVVASTPLSGDHLELVGRVTISIGLSCLPEDASDLNSLIELADNAMYQAKSAGRNRAIVWQADPPATSSPTHLVA